MHSIIRYLARIRGRPKHTTQHNLIHSIIKSSFLLMILFVLHIVFIVHFEGLSFGDAAWLTITTATTVGYGDLSASTTQGRFATVVLLYLGGIFILAKVFGDYFDYRLEVRDKKTRGQWSWKMKDHIVILNTPSYSGERYLQRLIKQFRVSSPYEETPIYLLTRQFPNGIPSFISNLENVLHYNGNASNPQDLATVCVKNAQIVIVLTKDENDEGSDGRTFDILHRLKDLDVKGRILAECVEDTNRKRLEDTGGNIVIRPIRAYPEMIVRAFVAPGAERIIENMFNSEIDEYRRYDVKINNMAWCDVVTQLIKNNVGIAVAYIDQISKEMVYNPPADAKPEIEALITISKNHKVHTNDEVKALIS